MNVLEFVFHFTVDGSFIFKFRGVADSAAVDFVNTVVGCASRKEYVTAEPWRQQVC